MGFGGGITPQGYISCDFFFERNSTPDSIEVELDESMNKVNEKRRNPADNYIVREIESGIVMTPEVAKAVGEWLINKVSEYETQIDDIDSDNKKAVK